MNDVKKKLLSKNMSLVKIIYFINLVRADCLVYS